VIVGDFNGDGNLLLENGDGTFQSALSFAAGTLTGPLGTGDLNGAGKLDLITTHASKNNVSVVLGNGDGTFKTPQQTKAILRIRWQGRSSPYLLSDWQLRFVASPFAMNATTASITPSSRWGAR